jgi:anti-sigma-K factor RskA
MNKEIEELLPFYALDALTDEEREMVEAYLTRHPEARQQVDELARAASAIPSKLTPVEPQRNTKSALMKRVTSDMRSRSMTQQQPSRSTSRFVSFFRAFSLAGAALALIWVVVLNVQMVRLQDELEKLGNALIAQSQSVEQINQQLGQASSSTVITISLKGTSARPQAQGELIANPNSQSAVVVVNGLADLEQGKTYQVWLIDSSGPVSVGLLAVDANGQGFLIITSETAIGSFNSLGISVEPEGGSPQPSGDIVVLSEL